MKENYFSDLGGVLGKRDFQSWGDHSNFCHLTHSFFGVAFCHIPDTNGQISVVEVFKEDCQRFHWAALLDTLLKIHAVDQEAIFLLKLFYTFINFVLDVIIHSSLRFLAHSQTCSLVEMLEWIKIVNTQRVLLYCSSDLLQVFYKGLLCFL